MLRNPDVGNLILLPTSTSSFLFVLLVLVHPVTQPIGYLSLPSYCTGTSLVFLITIIISVLITNIVIIKSHEE